MRQQVERGDWHGSEIGRQHKFLSSEHRISQDSEWNGDGSCRRWSGLNYMGQKQCCGTVTIYDGSGSGSGSDF